MEIESIDNSFVEDSNIDDGCLDDATEGKFAMDNLSQPTPRQRLLQAQNLDNQIEISQVLEDKLIIEDYSSFPTDIIIDVHQHVCIKLSILVLLP